jgi:hypothetical protein
LAAFVVLAGCGRQSNVISYGEGVELRTSTDVGKLKGAPQDFKQYIAGAADAAGSGADPTSECGPRVFVDKIDKRGYATGGVFDCGGARLIWAQRSNGVWGQIWGGQITPDCPTMAKFKVPTTIAGKSCWNVKKQKDVPYVPR